MDYLPLSDNAARQVIDSTTVFNEFMRVRAQARPYAGGMYWKKQGGYAYLVKTKPDNRQERIGPRSAETERIYQDFTSRKPAPATPSVRATAPRLRWRTPLTPAVLRRRRRRAS